MKDYTDIILEFRQRFEKAMDEKIQFYESMVNDSLNNERYKDDIVQREIAIDWWKAKIETAEWAKTQAMITESQMIADNLEKEMDLFLL